MAATDDIVHNEEWENTALRRSLCDIFFPNAHAREARLAREESRT